MAQLNIDPIRYLENLPVFDGNSQDLLTFCGLVDRMCPILFSFDVNLQPIFIDIIKSRLRGQAKVIMDINAEVSTWAETREILINNFSDKRSCSELFNEMRNTIFKTTCVDYYNEIMKKLQRLNIKAKLSNDYVGELDEYLVNNKTIALQIFMNELPEPMRSVLVCRNPISMEEAMNILFKSGYAHHGKNGRKYLERTGNSHENRNMFRNTNSNGNSNYTQNNSRPNNYSNPFRN